MSPATGSALVQCGHRPGRDRQNLSFQGDQAAWMLPGVPVAVGSSRENRDVGDNVHGGAGSYRDRVVPVDVCRPVRCRWYRVSCVPGYAVQGDAGGAWFATNHQYRLKQCVCPSNEPTRGGTTMSGVVVGSIVMH